MKELKDMIYMKNKYSIVFISVLLLIAATGCEKLVFEDTSSCTVSTEYDNHPKASTFNSILADYTAKGIPGTSLLIKDESGIWIGSSGMADIKNNIAMMPCHITKVASITKIFMATLAFQLAEEGKLDLDEKISVYLPKETISKITNADKVTVRQLIAHRTGIYDIIKDNGFYLSVLNQPDKNWSPSELLSIANNKNAAFEPGDAGYSNTNTLLLSMVIDRLGEKSHAKLMHEKIIEPLNLTSTFYYYHDRLPKSKTAQGYFDLFNNGTLVNLSNYNTGSGNGYTGLYSTVFDMFVFIDALLVKKSLVSEVSLSQMMDFHPKEETGKLLGAGIFKDFINHPSGTYGLGHRGRDLAYSADLFYFPESNNFFSFVVNYGTDSESKLRPVFFELRDEIVKKMME